MAKSHILTINGKVFSRTFYWYHSYFNTCSTFDAVSVNFRLACSNYSSEASVISIVFRGLHHAVAGT
jgi:hypothetical protein